MKRILYKLAAFILVPVVYYLIASGYVTNEFTTPQNTKQVTEPLVYTNPVAKDFTNCIFNLDYFGMGTNSGNTWSIKSHLPNYKYSLNFNALHIYGGDYGGRFQDPLSVYKDDVNQLMDDIDTTGLRGFYGRRKIEKLCYGQRLVYEAEGGNNGFSYQNRISTPITDGGRTVVKACATCPPSGSHSAGYLCQNIYENIQHSEVLDADYYGDRGQWFMKPVMKIDSSVVDNHPDWPVVTVQVFKFGISTSPIKTIEIKAKHFAQNLDGTLYGGQYLEVYNFIQDPQFNLEISGSTNGGLNEGWNWNLGENCHVDFKIYWHGQVDVWFDKMIVDDQTGNELFNSDEATRLFNESKVTDEVQEFFVNNTHSSLYTFFADEILYSNIPCAKRVQELIKQAGGTNAMLSCAATNYHNVRGLRNDDIFYPEFYRQLQPERYQVDAHLISEGYIPENIQSLGNQDPNIQPSWYVNTSSYNTRLQEGYFGDKNTIPADKPHGSLIYQINLAKTNADRYSPGARFVMQPQIHGFLYDNDQDDKYDEGLREPTNEEIQAQAMISIAHGADGLCWFMYQSFHVEQPVLERLQGAGMSSESPANRTLYCLGMLMVYPDYPDPDPRHINSYGQDKWNYVSDMNKKVNTWKTTLDEVTWQSGWSVHSEYNTGAFYGYISDIQSIDPEINAANPCVEDSPPNTYMDCEDERYWETGFFSNSSNEKYFMFVNRRCVPSDNIDDRGDVRILRIKFDPNDLSGSVNWRISEVGNSLAQPVIFSRYYNGYVDLNNSIDSLGLFLPGEGKLFKLEEVPKTGGTLVADEIITGESFTCEAPVYNNGHNITIGANTTIHFNDSSRFVMTGGVFTVGDQNTSAPQNITSDAVPGGSWLGHKFTNCEVKIYGATFSGLANDTTYAINIIDCPVVDIRNCTFNTNSSLKGGINAICFNNPFIAINNIYIGSNTFNSSGSTIPTVNVSSYAGVTTPLIIENNNFTDGNTAVFLSGVIGGAIKGNTITDNYIGINALTSSIDVVQNNISSTVNGSMGIFAAGGSELKLNSSGAFILGGLNSISNEGTGTNNINVDGSYFLLDDGENIFNISSDQNSYHLYGYFPMFTAVTTEETNNCFKVNSSPVDPPINMVTSGYQGSQITFNFIPYLAGCEIIGGGDGLAINLGNGIYDTIYTGGSGSGGSQSSVTSVRRTDTKQSSQRSRSSGFRKTQHAFDLPTAKTIPPRRDFEMTSSFLEYDSVCVLMRYRNYSQAKTKCLDLINTYPDSIQSLNAVSKLFLSTVASDTSYNAANNLKIYYENLILNHQSNTSLVKRANYFILKCKVRMREYSQALAGFQQIINLNPYSYEGLIARWDYMATSLLIQGQGGGERGISDLVLGNADLKEEDLNQYLDDNPQSENRNPNSTGNKNPFTKEQRKDIRKSINTAIDVSKNNDETKMKTLEEKSELGDVNASKELSQMKSLKQVVKTEKPKSINQHIKIVSEDIRKVFGSNTSSKGNQPKNLPTVFRISQNYPNPFNPVTKINYDLPKDSKVKIIIYDILGREVKRLVNNELKTAGSYIVDFNAMNYASGLYFYRIEAEEPNGNKFVDSKKMVLLK